MKIRVPASSANLGPGFDSCGIALSQYLSIEILEDSEEWLISHDLPGNVATGKENLIIETALSLAPDLTPKHLKMTSDIPLTRGLGSSSSAIVAGIELANRLGNLNLSEHQKICIGTEIEGHPDNVAPAIGGGFVVASAIGTEVYYAKHRFPDCDVIAFIPTTELATEASRSVLPKEFSYQDAVKASSIANVMIAAFVNSNLPLAGKMLEKDMWHERYRAQLVPHLEKIRELGHQYGAYGVCLSGAGPTVLVLSPEENTSLLLAALKTFDSSARVEVLNVDHEGVQVF